MGKLSHLEPKNVFGYFEDISAIPRGSGNMDGISEFCANFAKNNNLKYVVDDAKNVIIYKPGSKGYENAAPVILQGHMDMVCQKDEGCTIDFEKDGLDIYEEDGYVKARGTTLGADNGIAVAYMMAILSDNNLSHPPLECLFTTDEETGMFGAYGLDPKCLKGRKMINIDGGGVTPVLIGCAGGADFHALFVPEFKTVNSYKMEIKLFDFAGGHSGAEIHKGGKNANHIMAKLLDTVYDGDNFEIIDINGGNKTNVITTMCKVNIVSDNPVELEEKIRKEYDKIYNDIKKANPDANIEICVSEKSEYAVAKNGMNFISYMASFPEGVIAMSEEMPGLVETSMNTGIVKTYDGKFEIILSVRSSKTSDSGKVFEELRLGGEKYGFDCKTNEAYPPWELKLDTPLQKLFGECITKVTGEQPSFRAIHAGLECGIFASKIPDLDCVSVGPKKIDIHSTSERLDISSTAIFYEILLEVLKNSI